jgi:hypothetical protein
VYSKPFALGEDDPSFPQPINAEPSTPARAQTVNFLENGFFIAKPVVIFSALKIIKHPHALQAFNAQKNELFMPRRGEKFLYVSLCDIWRFFLEHGARRDGCRRRQSFRIKDAETSFRALFALLTIDTLPNFMYMAHLRSAYTAVQSWHIVQALLPRL